MLFYQQLNSEDVKSKFLLVSGVRDNIVTVKVFFEKGKIEKNNCRQGAEDMEIGRITVEVC